MVQLQKLMLKASLYAIPKGKPFNLCGGIVVPKRAAKALYTQLKGYHTHMKGVGEAKTEDHTSVIKLPEANQISTVDSDDQMSTSSSQNADDDNEPINMPSEEPPVVGTNADSSSNNENVVANGNELDDDEGEVDMEDEEENYEEEEEETLGRLF